MKVISVATWNKRFKYFKKFMSQFDDEFLKEFHYVVNMSEDDWKIFPQELKDEYKDKVEFNITKINYGSTNKLLPILKYNDKHPVMIMDDDCLYNKEYIRDMFNLNVKDCIIGTYGAIVNPQTSPIMFERTTTSELFKTNPNKKFFKKFMYEKNYLNKPVKDVIFYGHGTILYPANLVKFKLEDFEDFKNADDELAFKYSLEQNIMKYVYDNGKNARSVLGEIGNRDTGLCSTNDVENHSNRLIGVWKLVLPLCNFTPIVDIVDKKSKYLNSKISKGSTFYEKVLQIHEKVIEGLNLKPKPNDFFED